MKNSPILFLIGIAVVLFGGYFLYNKYSDSPLNNSEPKIKIDNTTKRPDLSNATFRFESEDITLKNGKAETELEGTNLVQVTTLTEKITYGELNSDNKEDAAALFLQEGGGTGVFVYLSSYVSGTVRYNGTNSIFIGDRINPQALIITNGVIRLSYLDRKEDEPFSATPTVLTTRSFVFANGELKELQ